MTVLLQVNETLVTVLLQVNETLVTVLLQVNETLVTVFNRFVRDNREKMYDLFIQMDRDQSGDITLEEFKYGLKDFGLRLTNV